MIKFETFHKNLNSIFKNRKFHEKQVKFFNYALEQINNDTNTENITVFPARCGLGKSTFLRVLVKSWLADNADEGLIIVTDNLKRLNEINDESDRRIAYLTADNKATERIRQVYCPILLMSTQRYFQMDSIEQFLHYNDKGVEKLRSTIIFDETPYFYEDGEIGINEINELHTALNEGITDLCKPDDKVWALAQYDLFRRNLIEQINVLEQKRNQTTYLFHQPTYSNITENDSRFYQIIENNPEIFSKFPKAKRILRDIQHLMQDGGFFTSYKLKDNNNYHKSFVIRHSYLDKFMLGRSVKTFIFDATADISEMYPFNVEWLNVLDCSDFNAPLDFLHINVIDVNTSRNALLKKDTKVETLAAIKDYISTLEVDASDTLFITYKTLLDNKQFDDIGFNLENSLYFGNTKGFNHSREKHNLIQIGLNRQTDITYLLNLLTNDEVWDYSVKQENLLDIQKNIAMMDSLLRSDLIDSYRCAELCADFIQNLYRTKARDLFNREKINVFLFCKNSENMRIELFYSLARLGATITAVDLESLKKQKIKKRKGDSIPKKILNWIEQQSKGRKFNIAEMLKEIGITQPQFKNVKRSNKYIRRKFETMKIAGTRGKYIIN